ncbi:hypothetical protein ACJ41O_010384 [Fusarium nematophilum]
MRTGSPFWAPRRNGTPMQHEMARLPEDFDRALGSIRRAKFPHPDGELLESFLQDSIDPRQAARYLLQRCSSDGDGPGLTLLLSEWKQLIAAFVYEGPIHQAKDKGIVAGINERDGGKCCITGLSNSFWDPLVVTRIFPVINSRLNESHHEILGAFVGPELRDWILSDAAPLDSYRNHWLVRRSAASAFSHGFFQFMFLKTDEFQYSVAVVRIGGPVWPDILDKTPVLRRSRFPGHAASGIDNPDVSALKVLSRFAKPIRWSLVARELERRKPRAVATWSPGASLWRFFWDRGATTLTTMWHLMPVHVRIWTYRGLASLGARMYGPSCSLKVQQLPFGMYLKMAGVEWHEGLANEYGALQLLRRQTHIPVPRPLDLVSSSQESYLLTSTLAGIRLGTCIDTLSDAEVKILVQDLQNCLGELRAIPKAVAPKFAITNVLGHACHDYRINAALDYDEDQGDFVGPIASEEDFSEILRTDPLPGVSHHSGHRIVFTHADLNMRNVLVHNGRLSGIVDWENSGWYPEYWDYTKAHCITRLRRRWLRIVDDVFKEYGDFESELAIERQLWAYCF